MFLDVPIQALVFPGFTPGMGVAASRGMLSLVAAALIFAQPVTTTETVFTNPSGTGATGTVAGTCPGGTCPLPAVAAVGDVVAAAGGAAAGCDRAGLTSMLRNNREITEAVVKRVSECAQQDLGIRNTDARTGLWGLNAPGYQQEIGWGEEGQHNGLYFRFSAKGVPVRVERWIKGDNVEAWNFLPMPGMEGKVATKETLSNGVIKTREYMPPMLMMNPAATAVRVKEYFDAEGMTVVRHERWTATGGMATVAGPYTWM